MDKLSQIIAQNIVMLRTAAHLTQAELAEALNYSDKSVSKWERAVSIPDVGVLIQIANLFKVSVDYLVTEHKEAPPFPTAEHYRNIRTITLLSLLSVLLAALITFTVLWMLGHIIWQIFIYALPVLIIVLLVFNNIWGNCKFNFFIITALVWSLLLVIYIALLQYHYWMLFIVGLPAQAVVFLSCRIGMRGNINLNKERKN